VEEVALPPLLRHHWCECVWFLRFDEDSMFVGPIAPLAVRSLSNYVSV